MVDTLAKLKNEIHAEMQDTYPVYDKQMYEKIADFYFESVDKEGFIFDFELAWQWCGYIRKDSGKRKLCGYGGKPGELRENVDYKITKYSDNLAPHCGEGTSKGAKHGGHNQEKIMLTSRGLNQFALVARTSVGQMVRDFVFQMMCGVKRLDEALKRGEVELKIVDSVHDRKRLKVCESQKALMSTVMSSGSANAKLCGMINGETNKGVTGKYKYELARELGLKPDKVNLRDRMTAEQLVAAELIEMLSKKTIATDGSQPLLAHKKVVRDVTGNIREILHASVETVPRRLVDIRKESKQIEKKRIIQNSTGLKNYFRPKLTG